MESVYQNLSTKFQSTRLGGALKFIEYEESSDQDTELHDQRGYHVLGGINAIYSEVVLNV